MSSCTDTAKVYLKAAALIAANKNRRQHCADDPDDLKFNGVCDVLSCGSVPYALGRHDLREDFRSWFVEGEGYYMMQDVMPEPEAQRVRVLALCFMAAMSERP